MLYEPLVLKANDTAPVVRAQLSADGVTPYVIPVGATVVLVIRNDKNTKAFLATVACSIEDATKGIVTYDRSGAENAIPGNYLVEFHVTGLDGSRRTFPNKGYAQIHILSELE